MEKWYVMEFGRDDEGGFSYGPESEIEKLFGYIPNKGDETSVIEFACEDFIEKCMYCVEHICNSKEEAEAYINSMYE
jgi:hypothetical protein